MSKWDLKLWLRVLNTIGNKCFYNLPPWLDLISIICARVAHFTILQDFDSEFIYVVNQKGHLVKVTLSAVETYYFLVACGCRYF